jgi:hypothetical protein
MEYSLPLLKGNNLYLDSNDLRTNLCHRQDGNFSFLWAVTNGFDVTQPEAKTFDIVDIAGVYAVEFIKNVFSGFFADAHAIVLHGNFHTHGHIAGTDGNFGFFRAVFIGVVEQVVDNAGKVGGIALDNGFFGLQIVRSVPFPFFHLEAEIIRLLDHFVQVELADAQLKILFVDQAICSTRSTWLFMRRFSWRMMSTNRLILSG